MTAHPVVAPAGAWDDVFNGRDLINARQTHQRADQEWRDVFDPTALDESCCRLRQNKTISGRQWSVQVWEAVTPGRHDHRRPTTTFVITDGVRPAAIIFTPARRDTAATRKDLLGQAMPGLAFWLGKPPHAHIRPPWAHLTAIHHVLTRPGGVPRFAVQAASLGVVDPTLVTLLSLADVNPAFLPDPREDDPEWTERVIRWVEVIRSRRQRIRMLNLTGNSLRAGQNATAFDGEGWALEPHPTIEVAVEWADLHTPWGITPDPDMLDWMFSASKQQGFSDPMPVDYVMQARTARWSAAQARVFFRFHLACCRQCRTSPPWPNTTDHSHRRGQVTLLGWAPLMTAAHAAAAVAAGYTAAEIAGWNEIPDQATLLVGAALRGVRVPVFPE